MLFSSDVIVMGLRRKLNMLMCYLIGFVWTCYSMCCNRPLSLDAMQMIKQKKTSMSILLILRRKCTLAASRTGHPPPMSHVEYALPALLRLEKKTPHGLLTLENRWDKLTDAETRQMETTLSAIHGEQNNLLWIIQPGVRISSPAKLTNNLLNLLVCPRTKVYFWHSSIKKHNTYTNQTNLYRKSQKTYWVIQKFTYYVCKVSLHRSPGIIIADSTNSLLMCSTSYSWPMIYIYRVA